MTGVETELGNVVSDVAEIKGDIRGINLAMSALAKSTEDHFRMVEDVKLRSVEDQIMREKIRSQERQRIREETEGAWYHNKWKVAGAVVGALTSLALAAEAILQIVQGVH